MTEELVSAPVAMLAREKGFDEPCRNLWMYADGKATEVNAPKDEEIVASFTGLFIKHMKDPATLLDIIGKLPKVRPLRNSTLPPTMYCRPTQDLLERWLREKHGLLLCICPSFNLGKINGYVVMNPATLNDFFTLTQSDSHYYSGFEEAREAALLHALKLLP